MLNTKFHIIFMVVILALVILCLHKVFGEGEGPQATPDGNVTITKHDFFLLNKYIQAQAAQLELMHNQEQYWENKYATAEECVRESLKLNKMVMHCFNDKEM